VVRAAPLVRVAGGTARLAIDDGDGPRKVVRAAPLVRDFGGSTQLAIDDGAGF